LFAPHYARPTLRTCTAGAGAVRATPSDQSEIVTELRPGDEFAVLEIAGGWAWGYRRADHHVGYVELADLST
jgi:dipeptidyl peptidase-like protein